MEHASDVPPVGQTVNLGQTSVEQSKQQLLHPAHPPFTVIGASTEWLSLLDAVTALPLSNLTPLIQSLLEAAVQTLPA